MSAAIHIELDGVPGATKALKRAPDALMKELTVAGVEAEMLLTREVKENTPVGIMGGSGGLKGSTYGRTYTLGTSKVETKIGTPKQYAVPVEVGTKPHMPPVQPLIDWAIVKLGKSAKEARGIGFAIALKIKAKGTEGQFMYHRAFKDNKDQVAGFYRAAVGRAAAILGKGA